MRYLVRWKVIPGRRRVGLFEQGAPDGMYDRPSYFYYRVAFIFRYEKVTTSDEHDIAQGAEVITLLVGDNIDPVRGY